MRTRLGEKGFNLIQLGTWTGLILACLIGTKLWQGYRARETVHDSVIARQKQIRERVDGASANLVPYPREVDDMKKTMTMTIKSKREEYERNIREWEMKLEEIQNQCPHTNSRVSDMVGYKAIYECNTCGKTWKEGDLD